MEIWQMVLLGYVGAFVVWVIINASFLLISMALQRKVFMVLETITGVLGVILSIAMGIGDVALIVWLFQNNQVIWALVAIFMGFGLVSTVGSLLAAPFGAITAGFSAWYDEMKNRV